MKISTFHVTVAREEPTDPTGPVPLRVMVNGTTCLSPGQLWDALRRCTDPLPSLNKPPDTSMQDALVAWLATNHPKLLPASGNGATTYGLTRSTPTKPTRAASPHTTAPSTLTLDDIL